MEMKYVIGEEVFFDEDNQLYYRYIGIDDKNKTLVATAWGKTEEEADERAIIIAISMGDSFTNSKMNKL